MDLVIKMSKKIKLKLDNVSIDLSNKKIIDNISFEIKKGDFVGIIGPNGAGKSTLLKAIYRVLKNKSGSIYLNSKSISEYSYRDSAKNMAVVSQISDINFDLKVIDMVLLGRSPYKKFLDGDNKEDYKIAIESIKKVGMLSFKERSFLSLSGGERQRVLLARALAQKTDFMILDEPTNHLDINHQLNFLDSIKKENITVLCAMHDLNISAIYCDKIIALKEGELLYYGYTNDVLTREVILELYDVDSNVKVENGVVNIRYIKSN